METTMYAFGIIGGYFTVFMIVTKTNPKEFIGIFIDIGKSMMSKDKPEKQKLQAEVGGE